VNVSDRLMEMDPRVRPGMRVRDADGRRLGKVIRCDAWGFEVVKGFWMPSEWVIRWDEVLDVRSGEVHVARSDRTLLELAEGKLPSLWTRRDRGEAPDPSGQSHGAG
jgi:hypothetical protein